MNDDERKMEKLSKKNVKKFIDEVNLRMEYAANSDIADILKRLKYNKRIEKERIKFSGENMEK